MVNSIDEAQALPYARAVDKRRAGPAVALLVIAAALAFPSRGGQGPPIGERGPPLAERGPPLAELEGRCSGLASLGPRVEGSAAEGSAFDYIAAAAPGSRLGPKESGLEDAVEGCSNSRVIEAEVRGRPARRARDRRACRLMGAARGALRALGRGLRHALALDEAARLEASMRAGESSRSACDSSSSARRKEAMSGKAARPR